MTSQAQIWRLFYDEAPQKGEVIKIENEEHHFSRNVLRIRPGELVEFTNGKGLLARTRLIESDKKDSKYIVESADVAPFPKTRVLLFVGTPKPSALEELISVGTELGAAQIHLIQTAKVQNKQELRIDRLYRIMRESMRISRCTWDTELFAHASLNDTIKAIAPESIKFLCDESPIYKNNGCMHNHLLNLLRKKEKRCDVAIFVGPEASFTQDERDFICREFAAEPVSLGQNILRVPTAAAAATTICKAFFTTDE